MNELLKIENAPGWVKNTENKAVLNSDLAALQQHKINKQKNIKIDSMEHTVKNLNDEISEIKNDILTIKDILVEFIKNSNNK